MAYSRPVLPSFFFKPFLPGTSCVSEMKFALHRFLMVMTKWVKVYLAGKHQRVDELSPEIGAGMREFLDVLASGDERLATRLQDRVLRVAGRRSLVFIEDGAIWDALKLDYCLFGEFLRTPSPKTDEPLLRGLAILEPAAALHNKLVSLEAGSQAREFLSLDGWVATTDIRPVFKGFLERVSQGTYKLYLSTGLLPGLSVLGEDLPNLFERARVEIKLLPVDDDLVLAAQVHGVPRGLEDVLYDAVLAWMDWMHPLALVDRYCTVTREPRFSEFMGIPSFLPMLDDEIMIYKAGMGADPGVAFCLEHTFHEEGPLCSPGLKEEAMRAAAEHGLPEYWRAFLRLPYPLLVKNDIEAHMFYPLARRYLEMLVLAPRPDLQVLALLGLFDRAMLLASYIVAAISSKMARQVSLRAYSPSKIGIFLTSRSCSRVIQDLVPGLLEHGMTAFYDLARPVTHYRINRLCNLENDLGHPRGQHITPGQAAGYISRYLRDLEFIVAAIFALCADWDIVVLDKEVQGNTVTGRAMRGSRPYAFPTYHRVIESLGEVSLLGKPCLVNYFTEELFPLYPLIIYRECPQCHEEELFAFLRLKGGSRRPEAAEYISLTSDHRYEAAELVNELYIYGYI